MATPNLGFDNKYSSTLTSGIAAADTTIPLVSLPTASEGYLVIEPDSSTAWEEIYYTSKTGSAVVCPSAALGRGQGGSTATSHSQGATVREDSTAEMFEALQDATGMTGLHRYGTDGVWFDFVASQCVWTADAVGSTRLASMTSGTVYINGRRHTVGTITSRTFTASKDTYVDLLYSTVDNVATPVYTEVTNNAASPALASNSIRVAIVVTGATTIATTGSINQGEEGKILPIASSTPYAVTDSLGNLICPRDPSRKLLGYRQITASFSITSTTASAITGLSVPVILPTGRKVKISVGAFEIDNNTADKIAEFGICDTSAADVNRLGYVNAKVGGQTVQSAPAYAETIRTPAATSKTYLAYISSAGTTGSVTVAAAAVSPAFIKVELV